MVSHDLCVFLQWITCGGECEAGEGGRGKHISPCHSSILSSGSLLTPNFYFAYTWFFSLRNVKKAGGWLLATPSQTGNVMLIINSLSSDNYTSFLKFAVHQAPNTSDSLQTEVRVHCILSWHTQVHSIFYEWCVHGLWSRVPLHCQSHGERRSKQWREYGGRLKTG